MKKFLVCMMAMLMVLSLAACSSSKTEEAESDLAYIKDKGVMIIGITDYAPMNYYSESGELIGFDTEFAKAVCQKLGVTPEFVEINWDSKEIELNAKSIDCIWNGFTVTDERRENMEFTDSYMRNFIVAIVKAENAAKYADLESIGGARIVAEMGSTAEEAVLAEFPDCNFTGVTKQTDALLEVKSGTADVAVLDYVLASAMVGEGTDYADLVIVDGVELAPEEYAIGFRLGSDVAAEVSAALHAMEDDGSLNALGEKYEVELQLICNQD